ncbi:MAG: hypothetical protein V4489_08065 [Chlamydiota bacterium]
MAIGPTLLLSPSLQLFLTEAEINATREKKTQSVANKYLDRVEAAKSEKERLELELKLDLFLQARAPPVKKESKDTQLERLMNGVLDENGPKIQQAVKIAFDDKIPLKDKITAIRVKEYDRVPDLYHTPSIRGIPNRGNTCFMNAGFQLIVNDPDLLQALVETYKKLLDQEDVTDFKRRAYQAFLNAVVSYQAGTPEKMDLNSLRILFSDPETQKNYAMGDVTEFMDTILQPVDPKEYPHLFCQVKEVKQLILASHLNMTTLKDLEYRTKELAIHQDDSKWIQQKYTTLSPDGVTTKTESFFTLMIPVPESKRSISGQNLLDDYFSKNRKKDEESAIYKQGHKIQCFSVESGQNILESSPPRLNISFNRFRKDGSKITTEVEMPKNITVPTKDGFQNYQLQSVAVHTGAHYISLLKKKDSFLIANDEKVHEATSNDIQYALTKGYLYVYKKL